MKNLESLDFDNTYTRLPEVFFERVMPTAFEKTHLVSFNPAAAELIDLDLDEAKRSEFHEAFGGKILLPGSDPIAMLYSGHQFGHYVPQLGDGRAILLGEARNSRGEKWDLQLKGAGETRFSRDGDGRAVLRSTIREYLCGEAMHGLGIPTTRSHCIIGGNEGVLRERPEPGAMLIRMAPTHVRFGSFEVFFYRKQHEHLKTLADYVIAEHFPHWNENSNKYANFLAEVARRTGVMIAHWQSVGWAHGVMNTDNMLLSGETIDYGPCAFIDAYEPAAVFSSIDTHGRYAYGKQPLIARWNLGRLAETLLPLIDADSNSAVQLAGDAVNAFVEHYGAHWLDGMRVKLGLTSSENGDFDLASGFLTALEGQNADYTLALRRLSDAARGDDDALRVLLDDPSAYNAWADHWRARLSRESVSAEARAQAMNRVNPIYIPRNHKVEEALTAAVEGQTLEPFETLLEVLESPFDEKEGLEAYASPAPESFGRYRTFCGT